MSQAPVALQVGGQTYRVRAQASEQDLKRLAATIDLRLRQLATPSRGALAPQNLLLVAITLAHELEHERAMRCDIERQANDTLQLMLEHIDHSLAEANHALAQFPQAAAQNEPF